MLILYRKLNSLLVNLLHNLLCLYVFLSAHKVKETTDLLVKISYANEHLVYSFLGPLVCQFCYQIINIKTNKIIFSINKFLIYNHWTLFQSPHISSVSREASYRALLVPTWFCPAGWGVIHSPMSGMKFNNLAFYVFC